MDICTYLVCHSLKPYFEKQLIMQLIGHDREKYAEGEGKKNKKLKFSCGRRVGQLERVC